MTTTAIAFNGFVLPWEATRREDERYRRILKRLFLAFLLLGIVFPLLPLPEIERELEKIEPPAMAKVILHHRKPAPPPPPPALKQAPEKKSVKKAAAPAPKKKAKPAGKAVAKMGVGAFSKQLQSLRSSLDVAKLHARNTNIKTGAAARTSRSVLGRETATKTSGGVNTSVMNGKGGGTQLSGRSGVAVASPMGDGGGGGGTGSGSGTAGAGGGGKHNSSVAGGRDMESIRRVFEQHKGAIYAIYNRALRRDPEIMGKYVFHIVIEPSGEISSIKLVSSELGNGGLEHKLLARIRGIDFGPEDVLATPVNYKFDFLPS
ncbi:MAG: AgmX/PglI C-terminal domain-containing protein [Gammaproteobacteria bacterium]|nr:AgmX/PglI C-terminal domain-containing protein [Gammaproteobacteria bacterium]